MRFGRLVAVGLIGAVVIGSGCRVRGSTPRVDSLGTRTPSPEAPRPLRQFFLPQTPLVATLDLAYKIRGQEHSEPQANELPQPAGSAQALWYQSDGDYAVYFESVGAGQDLCLGASIETVAGPLFKANAPLTPGACGGEPAQTSAIVWLCGVSRVPVYATAIPVATAGLLRATMERQFADGTAVGLTGSIAVDGASAPQIDLSGCSPAAQ